MIILVLLLIAVIVALAAYAASGRMHSKGLESRISGLEAKEERVPSFAEAMRLLAASANVPALADALAESAKILSGAELSATLLKGESGAEFRVDPPGNPASSSLERFLRQEGIPEAPRRLSALYENPDYRGISEALLFPVVLKDEAFGSLAVANSRGGGFSEEEEDMLVSLCAVSALAIKKINACEELQYNAVRDPLTGLYNYRAFQERLASEAERARRYQNSLSLLMLDVDDFKHFNLSFGRDAADRALKKVASIINETIRNIDFAARYGGEEFVVMLPESSPENAAKTAERIRRAVEDAEFNSERAKLTITIGAASLPSDADDKDQLIKEADGALYIAKRRGKNRVQSAGRLTLA